MLTSSTRLVRRLLAVGAALTLTVGLAGAAPAVAADRDDDGGQPLPGYTINNPPLAPLEIQGAPTTVRQGVHQHAGYIIEVPAQWNGDLVMWTHGYRGQTTVLIGDGAGGFTAAAPVGVGSGPVSVALGDVNNAQITDEDTGFQGIIDSEGWRRLDVRGPNGQVMSFAGRGSLAKLGVTDRTQAAVFAYEARLVTPG